MPRTSKNSRLVLIGLLAAVVACEPQSFARPQRDQAPLKPPSKIGDLDTSLNKNVCEQPRKRAAGSSVYIVNGTREPTLIPLAPAQKLAVVSLADRWGSSFCSGTLVSGRFVFTAKHCTTGETARNIQVQFSQDGRAIVWTTDVEQIYEHSTADLAILKLSADATQHLSVVPVPVNPQALDSSWVGVRVESSGFGVTSPSGSADGRYFVALPVDQVSRSMLTVYGEGYHGVCFGDSGGPVFGLVDGSIRALGALSNGDSSCTGRDNYTRADVYLSWIEGIVGTTPPLEASGCGSVSSEGRCEAEGGRAVYCDSGTLREDRCDQGGQTCGYDADASGYRCVDVQSDPCQGLDTLGSCQGDTAVWCASGEIRRFNCGQCGWTCGWASDATGFDCVQRVDSTPPAVDPCENLDYLGRCDGNTAQWCNGGEYHSVDCGDHDATCRYIDGNYGYYCAQDAPAPAADPCDGLSYLGRCDGNTAEWCDGGEYHSVDCADYSARCGY
ncbi:MAG: trypsin-like serine protease, partial [Pseudomonadota bacterium]